MPAHRPQTNARLRLHAYVLVEVLTDGSLLRETFEAPDNSEAIARVQRVLEGHEAELWRGMALVRRWKRVAGRHAMGARSFQPADARTRSWRAGSPGAPDAPSQPLGPMPA